jgi:VCBS repeat-containing protein
MNVPRKLTMNALIPRWRHLGLACTLVGTLLGLDPGSAHAQLSQSLGRLAPGESVTLSFEVTIDAPLSASVTQLSAQGTVTYDGGGSVPTDDPETAALDDPTITLLAHEFDFGDAPDPTYPTLLANDGARHLLSGGGAALYLGAGVPDAEPDGQSTSSADGDGADEDGVSLPPLLAQGGTATVTVTLGGGPGYLNAWIDFNRDGDWSDAGEQVFTDRALTVGSQPLDFTVPADAPGGLTFARFRLTSASSLGSLSFTGPADDGEVEDYAITLNTGPVGVSDDYTLSEGGTLSMGDGAGTTTPGNTADDGVLANDTDVDGQVLSALLVSGPAHASTFSLGADGSFTYTHDGTESFSDSFVYQVSDGILTSAPVTVALTITEVNDPPVAGDDLLSAIDEDSGMRTIPVADLLANDSAGTGESSQTLTLLSVGNPVGGAVAINGANVEFTPTLNFNGIASFDYTVQDDGTTAGVSDFQTDTGRVSFTVNPVNDPPVAGADSVTRVRGRTVKVALADLLSNDTDVDGPDALRISAVSSPSANGATVRILGDWLVYEADAGDAPDSFSYALSDGLATSAGFVSVAVISAPAGLTLNIVSESSVGGERRFLVAAIPGRTYQLQIATSVTGPWAALSDPQASGLAGGTGEVLLRDVAPPTEPPAVFYRVTEP